MDSELNTPNQSAVPAAVSRVMCGGTLPIWRPALKTWARPSRSCQEPPSAQRGLVDVSGQDDVWFVFGDPGGELVVGELATPVTAEHRARRWRVVEPDPPLRTVDCGCGQEPTDEFLGNRTIPTTGTW